MADKFIPPYDIPGTLDLDKRKVYNIPDGKGIMTENSIAETFDPGLGYMVSMPTVINGNAPVSREDAVKHFNNTGEFLGAYVRQPNESEQAFIDRVNAGDTAVHERQAKFYGGNKMGFLEEQAAKQQQAQKAQAYDKMVDANRTQQVYNKGAQDQSIKQAMEQEAQRNAVAAQEQAALFKAAQAGNPYAIDEVRRRDAARQATMQQGYQKVPQMGTADMINELNQQPAGPAPTGLGDYLNKF